MDAREEIMFIEEGIIIYSLGQRFRHMLISFIILNGFFRLIGFFGSLYEKGIKINQTVTLPDASNVEYLTGAIRCLI